MGVEHELLTLFRSTCTTDSGIDFDNAAGSRNHLLASDKELAMQGWSQFYTELRKSIPAVAGPTGVFTGYGRIYCDCGHVELASAECDDPFELTSMMERLQRVVVRAATGLRESGIQMDLANCNHAGLLCRSSETWGSHGNYLVRCNPGSLADALLPFLATRVYTGAGGIEWPSGNFVASTRALFVATERGGGTIQQRALFSDARNEHLTRNPAKYGFRLHTISDDGVRSQFSFLLQHAPLLLVAKAMSESPSILKPLPLPQLRSKPRAFWLEVYREFNRLAAPGNPPIANPMMVRIQRFYLMLVERYIEQFEEVPAWVGKVLAIWESTLNALERNDLPWLSQRLDPWIKYRVFSEYLAQKELTWSQIAHHRDWMSELALVNQNYHELTSEASIFAELEANRSIRHRVVQETNPGSEPEPYVPALQSRATARARWISENAGCGDAQADWDQVGLRDSNQCWRLDDPCSPMLSK